MAEYIKARLRKIAELASSGVEGERDNARAMLDKLLSNYGIDEADLYVEERRNYEFKVRNATERKLLMQIVGSLESASEVEFFRYKGKPNLIILKLTPRTGVNVRLMWESYIIAYRKQLRAMQKNFIQAFFVKNDLIVKVTEEGGSKKKTGYFSEDDYRQIIAMAGALRATPIPFLRLEEACQST